MRKILLRPWSKILKYHWVHPRWLFNVFITTSEYLLPRAEISEITCILHSFHEFDASHCSKSHNVVDNPIVWQQLLHSQPIKKAKVFRDNNHTCSECKCLKSIFQILVIDLHKWLKNLILPRHVTWITEAKSYYMYQRKDCYCLDIIIPIFSNSMIIEDYRPSHRRILGSNWYAKNFVKQIQNKASLLFDLGPVKFFSGKLSIISSLLVDLK